jgi:hypothetical protein
MAPRLRRCWPPLPAPPARCDTRAAGLRTLVSAGRQQQPLHTAAHRPSPGCLAGCRGTADRTARGLDGLRQPARRRPATRRRATYNLDQTHMRGLLVRPIGTSNHLEKPPRIFFPPGLPNEMVTVYAAANDAISYIYISPIRNVNIDSFSGCAALTSTPGCGGDRCSCSIRAVGGYHRGLYRLV